MQQNNLQKIREDRLMSRAELAQKAGLCALTIGRIERGHSCLMPTKRKILQALEIPLENRSLIWPAQDPA